MEHLICEKLRRVLTSHTANLQMWDVNRYKQQLMRNSFKISAIIQQNVVCPLPESKLDLTLWGQMGGGELKDFSGVWLRFYKKNTLSGTCFPWRHLPANRQWQKLQLISRSLPLAFLQYILVGLSDFQWTSSRPLIQDHSFCWQSYFKSLSWQHHLIITSCEWVWWCILFCFPVSPYFYPSTKIINPSLSEDFTEHMFRLLHTRLDTFFEVKWLSHC